MSAELRPFPTTVFAQRGEALDGYLERLAAANGYTPPQLIARLTDDGATITFLTIAPDPRLLERTAELARIPGEDLRAMTLQTLTGIEAHDLDAADKLTWRKIAARGWPPQRGTALCAQCFGETGRWQIDWRHPWVTVCLEHSTWLLATCPACGGRFRSHDTPLRPVDTPAGVCGNSQQARGRCCRQALSELLGRPAPSAVVASQQRIAEAVHGHAVEVLGELTPAASFLAELRALTVLLLHLATRPGGEDLADWAAAARRDRSRSRGGRGARWGLAPPADLTLRGRALGAASIVLGHRDLQVAADDLQPWLALVPRTNEGQLGWLADHTTMTPALTRLVMSATAPRRRLRVLLVTSAQRRPRLPATVIPQQVPADLYRAHVAPHLSVTENTGRLFSSLSLALGRGANGWADAALCLGLLPSLGIRTARACTGHISTSTSELVDAIDELASHLDVRIDYRARENAVRRLASRTRWHTRWAREHHRGSQSTSHRYAVAWLWATYAGGHIDTSPGCAPLGSTAAFRAHYRRYASRISPTAQDALIEIARKEGESPCQHQNAARV